MKFKYNIKVGDLYRCERDKYHVHYGMLYMVLYTSDSPLEIAGCYILELDFVQHYMFFDIHQDKLLSRIENG